MRSATSRDTVARMPIPRRYTTDAIVLSRFDLGEADRVLTLITPGIGKLKAIAKGVRRPTSRLGGSLEPFAELTVALARGRTFDVVTQVSVGHAWLNLRDLLESAATAWYLAELADRSLEERHAAEPLYALLRRAYELLDAGMAPGRVARWYEMHLLDELGQRPEVDRCVECDRVLEAEERFRWVPPLGGILCERCPGPGHDRTRISLDALKLLKAYQRLDIEAISELRLARERRARDRGRVARIRSDRARARRPLAGVPRRGPDGALKRRDEAVGVALAVGAAGAATAVGSRVVGRALVGRTEARPVHDCKPGARTTPSDRARALHDSLWVADLHADSLLWGRDLLERATRGQVDVPRLRDGNVALQVLAATTKSPTAPQHREQRRPQRRCRAPRARPGLAAGDLAAPVTAGSPPRGPGGRPRGRDPMARSGSSAHVGDLAAYEAARLLDPALDGRAARDRGRPRARRRPGERRGRRRRRLSDDVAEPLLR